MRKAHQMSEVSPCGCAGQVRADRGDHGLSYLTAALERMNGRPAAAEIQPEPEDDAFWVRQCPEPDAVPAESAFPFNLRMAPTGP
jgi:hypothetical protein